LNATASAHPALFAVEYALAQLWMHWGIRPVALLGHSLGEYVAACIAGVMSFADAARIVTRRAQLIQELPVGGMLAVAQPADQLSSWVSGAVSLAASNAPALSVLSGERRELDRIAQELTARKVAHRQVPAEHAFHSRMMEPIREPLAALFKGVELRAPQVPYISNLTGTWITAEQATDPRYWAAHTCQTVRFAEGLERLGELPVSIFLEVGPGTSLTSFATQSPAVREREGVLALASLPASQERCSSQFAVARTLAALWSAGCPVDWAAYHAEVPRQRVALPGYAFERQRCWIDAPARGASHASAKPAESSTAVRLYSQVWSSRRLRLRSAPDLSRQQSWLLFMDPQCTLAHALRELLAAADQKVTCVTRGAAFTQSSAAACVLQADSAADYHALARVLATEQRLPDHIIHLWNHGAVPASERALAAAYLSPLLVAQALCADPARSIHLGLISSGVHAVADEALHPPRAMLLGPCRVIPLEYTHVRCSNIDLSMSSATRGDAALRHDARAILAEFTAGLPGRAVALRGGERWIPEHRELTEAASETRLQAGATYVLWGYEPGRAIAVSAVALARLRDTTLVLLPARSLEPHAPDILQLEVAGARVVLLEPGAAGVQRLPRPLGRWRLCCTHLPPSSTNRSRLMVASSPRRCCWKCASCSAACNGCSTHSAAASRCSHRSCADRGCRGVWQPLPCRPSRVRASISILRPRVRT
jgi:phthiocerol/phenolphthiocerol synthesis type-I polyketide synthase E